MSVFFTILGSGSAGNCSYVESGETRLLVDAGFSPRQIRQRLAGIGRTPEQLTGILLTHEHSDHIAGLVGLAGKLHIPVYCNRETQEATVWALTAKKNPKPATEGDPPAESREAFKKQVDWRLFQTGDRIDFTGVEVETFSIPHDAQDPVGFLLRTPGGNIGFATDLGHTTKLILERIRHANVLVLESNHDIKMLQACPRRSWSLKQRILGRHGHLSNPAAAEAVAQIMSSGMKHLYLAHLSRECNTPKLAENVMAEQLHQIGATHVRLEVAQQDCPSATLRLESASQAD